MTATTIAEDCRVEAECLRQEAAKLERLARLLHPKRGRPRKEAK